MNSKSLFRATFRENKKNTQRQNSAMTLFGTEEITDSSSVLLLTVFLLIMGTLVCLYFVCCRDELYIGTSRTQTPKYEEDV